MLTANKPNSLKQSKHTNTRSIVVSTPSFRLTALTLSAALHTMLPLRQSSELISCGLIFLAFSRSSIMVYEDNDCKGEGCNDGAGEDGSAAAHDDLLGSWEPSPISNIGLKKLIED